MKKKIFARLGVTITLTEDQFSQLSVGGTDAAVLIREKVSQGEFELEGETYFPAHNSSDSTEWSHSRDIELQF